MQAARVLESISKRHLYIARTVQNQRRAAHAIEVEARVGPDEGVAGRADVRVQAGTVEEAHGRDRVEGARVRHVDDAEREATQHRVTRERVPQPRDPLPGL